MIVRDPGALLLLSSGMPYITPTIPVNGAPVLPAKGDCPSINTPSISRSMIAPVDGTCTYATTEVPVGESQKLDGWLRGGFVERNAGTLTDTEESEISVAIAELDDAHVQLIVQSAPVTFVLHILTPRIRLAAKQDVARGTAPEVLTTARRAQKSD